MNEFMIGVNVYEGGYVSLLVVDATAIVIACNE